MYWRGVVLMYTQAVHVLCSVVLMHTLTVHILMQCRNDVYSGCPYIDAGLY